MRKAKQGKNWGREASTISVPAGRNTHGPPWGYTGSVANRKQQKRKYLRAVGRGKVRDGGETRDAERAGAKSGGSTSQARSRREPPQPSAARAAKRAAVFAVLFYLAISYTSLGGKMTGGVKLFNAAIMFVLFWSIGTITETFAWRRWQKKHGG
jgi:hypothetical protein